MKIEDLAVAACRAIENAEEPLSLAELARAARLSPFHFQRLFKSAVGLTPKAYAAAVRAKRLRAALPKAGSVTSALYEAGFGSSGRFYENASRDLGMAP